MTLKEKWTFLSSNPLWSRVIGSVIVGAVLFGVPWIYYHYPKTPQQNPVSAMRIALINGSTWQGTASAIYQAGEEEKVKPFQITYHFLVQKNTITGTSSFEREGQLYETDLRGEFYNETLLKFEYVHRKGINAFGYVILQIEQIPTKMSGKCVVYGAATHAVSVGNIELNKVEH